MRLFRAVEMVDETCIHKAERELSADSMKTLIYGRDEFNNGGIMYVYGIEHSNKESVNDTELSRTTYYWLRKVIHE